MVKDKAMLFVHGDQGLGAEALLIYSFLIWFPFGPNLDLFVPHFTFFSTILTEKEDKIKSAAIFGFSSVVIS